MHIALVTREYPPDTAWGGIGSFYHYFSVALAAVGHSVEVFCQSISDERSVMTEGVLVHHVLGWHDGTRPGVPDPMAGNADIGVFAFGLASAMLDAVQRRHAVLPFDIIEGHEHLGINALINNAKLPGSKTITRYQSAYSSLVSRQLVDWPASAVIRSLERQSVRLADLRIATSQFISEVNAQDFAAPLAEALIVNLADNPSAEHLVADRGAREDLILFVGRMVLNHKRPDLVIQAFAALAERFPTLCLEVAGPDMDLPQGGTVWQHCLHLLPSTLTGRVHYHGALPPAKVQALYRRAKILIVPSSFEASPMVAIEAMRAACVPVVADKTGLVDLVGDMDLTFANGSLDGLCERLAALLGDTDLLRAKSSACHTRALTNLSTSALLGQNIVAYERVLGTDRCTSLTGRAAPERPAPAGNANDPLISIVVPSFNQGAYIGETIRSILEQDYPNIEVIVMDGGSTDSTIEVLRRFPQITWFSEPDLGQTHAINKGMLLARGAIRAYLNSDDVYRPGAFRKIVEIFRNEPETKILVGNCDYIDEKSAVIGHLRAKFTDIRALVQYWGWERLHCIPQQATFWRASLMSEVGLFNTELGFVMDHDYWLRVAMRTNFRTVDQTLAGYRLMAGTKTVSRTDEMYDEEYEEFRRFRYVLPPLQRLIASMCARRHYGGKLLMFAQHWILAVHLRRKPARTLLRVAKIWPIFVISPSYLLCILHLALTPIESQEQLGPFHRRQLEQIDRLKRRFSSLFQGKLRSLRNGGR
jgi:glycosyltransferase involved in cell wall biosynthesis